MNRHLTMIHGAFAGAWCFDDFRQPFAAAGWQVSSPELPYHGAAVPPAAQAEVAGLGLRDYADALEQHIRALPDSEKPVLLGHSLGGLLAQLLAARGLARGLILLAPVAPWGILPSSEQEIAAATGLMALGDFRDRALRPDFAVAAASTLNHLTPTRQRDVFDRFGSESGRALFESLFWMFDAGAASHVNAINVDCPVLCVAGGSDGLIAPTTVRQVADRYAEVATLEQFDDMGHMLPLEDGWEELAQACLDWLATSLV